MTEECRSSAAFAALASGALAGPESEAWHLVREAWPEIHGRVRACLAAAGLPLDWREDCGQAVLVRVWRFRSGYRGRSAGELAAWMNRIARNESARALQRAGRIEAHVEPEQAMDLTTVPDPRASPGRRAEQRDDLRALEECLAALESRQRQVVELLYADTPLSEREAVEVLGVSKSHVHTLRKQALSALARCLEGKGVA